MHSGSRRVKDKTEEVSMQARRPSHGWNRVAVLRKWFDGERGLAFRKTDDLSL